MPVRRYRDIEDIDSEAADPEEEQTKPAPKRRAARRASTGTDDTPRPKRRKVVEAEPDEEERPMKSSVVQTGWKAAKEVASDQGGDWVNDFKWTEEQQLVKFLTDEPMAYRQHWLDRTEGKRGHVCLGKGECPLCDAGVTASAKYAFSVVNLSEDDPKVYLLVVGVRVLQQLEAHHQNPKTGPLTKGFWALSRTGKRQKTVHDVQFVKERDLAEDWSLDPEEIDELLDSMEPATEDDITVTPAEELEAILSEG